MPPFDRLSVVVLTCDTKAMDRSQSSVATASQARVYGEHKQTQRFSPSFQIHFARRGESRKQGVLVSFARA